VNTLAARNGGRAGLAALTTILLLGLGLRVESAWQGRAPVFDAAAYATIARNLDEGHGFTLGAEATQPASNYSPGLPLFASALYKLSGGPHERLARLVLALIGSLAVLFTYLIARRLCGPAAGLIGAAAIATYPALLEYQGMLMSEPLAATLLSGAVLSMLWAGDTARTTSRAPEWLVPGLLLGALALTRPEYLAVAALLAMVVFVRGVRGEWRGSLLQAAIVLAGVALVVVPWTTRNAVALDRFAPISTGGGQVLFAGAYMPSDGDPERVGEEVLERHPGLTRRLTGEEPRLEQILAALAAQRYPGLETDKALSRMGRERLWREIRDEPLAYAAFLAKKVERIWAHGPRDVMRTFPWQPLHWALVALGLLGLVVLACRRRWEALVLATVLLAITAISALLVASPRRVLVMMPLVSALAGFAIAWLWAETRKGHRPLKTDAPPAASVSRGRTSP
jgi:4-amino-4-deoxy-L-arabinose transferase-like glycosyltransferase